MNKLLWKGFFFLLAITRKKKKIEVGYKARNCSQDWRVYIDILSRSKVYYTLPLFFLLFRFSKQFYFDQLVAFRHIRSLVNDHRLFNIMIIIHYLAFTRGSRFIYILKDSCYCCYYKEDCIHIIFSIQYWVLNFTNHDVYDYIHKDVTITKSDMKKTKHQPDVF
jgi:hypothetical protein